MKTTEAVITNSISAIAPAFTDAVHDSQSCFRNLLKAMSEPGKQVILDKAKGFGSLSDGATQILLTLADHHTPIWLAPKFSADKTLIENIRFHISAPLTTEKQQAAFAVMEASALYDPASLLTQFNAGNEEYPDTSATLIIDVESLTDGDTLRLSGPGIKSQIEQSITGLPKAFIDYLSQRQQQQQFPLGVDFIFVAGRQLMCLPRTTCVEVL